MAEFKTKQKAESEGTEKDTPDKWKTNRIWVAILIGDTTDFKLTTIIRDKKGHYIMINE